MTRVETLAAWVSRKHHGQIIRRTNEPYFNHLTAVAKMAGPAVALGYEIGLCHDLLEDTGTTSAELLDALLSFGYTDAEAQLITGCVVELTDVYTRAAYPDLSKSERKARESARLPHISAIAQTVKYGDLIYNVEWVVKYDRKHARKYLLKKQLLLTGLTQGNDTLRQQALDKIHSELLKVKGKKPL